MGSTDISDSPQIPGAGKAALTVATFNLHAGIDGWGRPFDVVGACRVIDADVLVLQESWTPENGPGTATTVGETLGYTVFEQPLAGGRVAGPHARADERWMRPFDWRGSSHAIYLDSEVRLGTKVVHSGRYLEAEPGQWGVAVLSRLPARLHQVIDLGRLKRDPAQRFAVAVETRVAGIPVTVIGTHMSHITYGAPKQFLRLSCAVHRTVGSGPAVLAGDMNLWGPPVSAFFPGWQRAVRGRTWPAWRPHSQVDHILVRGAMAVEGGEVLTPMGSDHLPVRTHLTIRS